MMICDDEWQQWRREAVSEADYWGDPGDGPSHDEVRVALDHVAKSIALYRSQHPELSGVEIIVRVPDWLRPWVPRAFRRRHNVSLQKWQK